MYAPESRMSHQPLLLFSGKFKTPTKHRWTRYCCIAIHMRLKHLLRLHGSFAGSRAITWAVLFWHLWPSCAVSFYSKTSIVVSIHNTRATSQIFSSRLNSFSLEVPIKFLSNTLIFVLYPPSKADMFFFPFPPGQLPLHCTISSHDASDCKEQ